MQRVCSETPPSSSKLLRSAPILFLDRWVTSVSAAARGCRRLPIRRSDPRARPKSPYSAFGQLRGILGAEHPRRTALVAGSVVWYVCLAVLMFTCAASAAEPSADAAGQASNDQAGFVFKVREAKPDLSNWDFVGVWGEASSVSLIPTGEGRPAPAWQCKADRRSKRVGKAYVTVRFPRVGRNDVIEAQATFLIQRAPADGSLYLLDIECRDCGLPTKAGIRVLVRDGVIRVNRSKLGQNQDFIAARPSVRIGEPFTLTVRLKLGDDDGETTVLVNDQVAIRNTGVNMPLSRVAAASGVNLKQEQFDYVQFGITANSGSEPAEVIFSNAEIRTPK